MNWVQMKEDSVGLWGGKREREKQVKKTKNDSVLVQNETESDTNKSLWANPR